MRYYCILASFCLLGMASSQSIVDLTACFNKEQNLVMNCTFTQGTGNPTCTYKTEGKVIATNGTSEVQDPTFKGRGTVNITGQVCTLLLTGFSSSLPKNYSCFITQSGTATKTLTVDKKTSVTCSACELSAVSLLLLLIFPVLSKLL